MSFNVGDFIGVKCDVMPGPFDDERLITVNTVDGAVSGFVKTIELREVNGEWEVRARVQDIKGQTITVWLYGSFFTTNGIANIPSHLATAAVLTG